MAEHMPDTANFAAMMVMPSRSSPWRSRYLSAASTSASDGWRRLPAV